MVLAMIRKIPFTHKAIFKDIEEMESVLLRLKIQQIQNLEEYKFTLVRPNIEITKLQVIYIAILELNSIICSFQYDDLVRFITENELMWYQKVFVKVECLSSLEFLQVNN